MEDKITLESLFSKIKEEGKPSTTRVYFNGSGDSGDIDGHTQDGTALPNDVLHYFYRWLENFYGGWEVNEGSHGRFNFNFDEKKIYLDFNEHTDETESHGKICHIQF